MGYLQDLQRELRQLLGDMEEAKQKEIALWVGKKVLESYHNGQADAEARAQLARLGTALTEQGQNLHARSASGVRQLPIVKIGKTRYYRDDRLQEYRNMKNPHDRISFHPEAQD